MLLNLTNFSSMPIHEQVVYQILSQIVDEELNSGDELIPVGKLSRQQHVGKSTIAKAYAELERMRSICRAQNERYKKE